MIFLYSLKIDMKKFAMLSLFLIFFLSACAGSSDSKKQTAMNELAADNMYHYQNKDLGFEVALPSEFIYYQTQRKNTDDYIDLEIFVPTGDRSYYQEIPGYGKPVVIRIFEKDTWEQVKNEEENIKLYKKIGEEGGRVYTIRLWNKIPVDWRDKWTKEMGEEIIHSFKLK